MKEVSHQKKALAAMVVVLMGVLAELDRILQRMRKRKRERDPNQISSE